MSDGFTFWLAVLTVLSAYLCGSVWLRHRAQAREEEARLCAVDAQLPGSAFDASAIAPRIRRVRQEYAALARERSRPAFHRAELMAAARRIVAHLAFFRTATQHEHELHKPGG